MSENKTTLSPAKLALEYTRGNHQQKNEVLNRLQDATPTEQREFWDYANNPADIPDVEITDDRFRVYTGLDALGDFEDDEPMLPNGMFVRGDTVAVTSESGAGKSLLVKHWLLSAANIGFNAFYLNEEMKRKTMQKRIKALVNGMGIEMPANFYWTSNAGIDLREPAHIAQIREWIIKYEISIFAIDSLVSVLPGADENSTKDMKPPLQTIRRLADELNVCIVIIHHTNKMGGYRGSSAIKGEMDAMYMLSSQNNGSELAIKTEKMRDGAPFSLNYAVQFTNDDEGKLYSVTYAENATGSRARTAFSKSEKYVIRFLSDKESASVSDIMNNADTCASNTARFAVYSLADKGYTTRVNLGQKGAAAVYSLTSSGKEASCLL